MIQIAHAYSRPRYKIPEEVIKHVWTRNNLQVITGDLSLADIGVEHKSVTAFRNLYIDPMRQILNDSETTLKKFLKNYLDEYNYAPTFISKFLLKAYILEGMRQPTYEFDNPICFFIHKNSIKNSNQYVLLYGQNRLELAQFLEWKTIKTTLLITNEALETLTWTFTEKERMSYDTFFENNNLFSGSCLVTNNIYPRVSLNNVHRYKDGLKNWVENIWKNKLINLSLHINVNEFYIPNTMPLNAVTRFPQPTYKNDLESYYEIACSLLTIFAENCSVLQKYKRNIIWQNAVSEKNWTAILNSGKLKNNA